MSSLAVATTMYIQHLLYPHVLPCSTTATARGRIPVVLLAPVKGEAQRDDDRKVDAGRHSGIVLPSAPPASILTHRLLVLKHKVLSPIRVRDGRDDRAGVEVGHFSREAPLVSQ